MGTHTKIIITTPNLNWALAPSVFQGIRELLPTSVDFFKHPVGMVHFLLQNLTLEKILILKSNLCQNNQIKKNYQLQFSKNWVVKNLKSTQTRTQLIMVTYNCSIGITMPNYAGAFYSAKIWGGGHPLYWRPCYEILKNQQKSTNKKRLALIG